MIMSSSLQFGFEWGGWYFTSYTIPIGWKASAYIYHSIGLLASHYFRSLRIPCSLYSDDRHRGEIQLAPLAPGYAFLSSGLDKSLARARLFFWSGLLLLIWVISLVSKNLSSSQGKLLLSLAFWLTLFANPFCLLREKKQKFLPFASCS